MKKRGAYFFVIDAIIAGTVILAAMMFIFGTHSVKPDRDPTLRGSEDFLKYISSTKMREYESSLTTNLTANGEITNLDNSIIEQMVEFYCTQKNSTLKNFTAEIATRIIAPERGLIINISGTSGNCGSEGGYLAYNSTFHQAASNLQNSELVITTKRMSFSLINETTIFGPVWIEVKVWV